MKLMVMFFMHQKIIFSLCFFGAAVAQAQTSTVASVPYTPSWTARHYLQWLSDHAGLPLTSSHWPLPAAAVEQALSGLTVGDAQSDVQVARDFVQTQSANAIEFAH